MKKHRHNGLRYQVYRSQARKLAWSVFATDPQVKASGINTDQVRLEPIGNKALDALQLWGEKASNFPWEDVPSWKERDSKGLDLSLWFDQELCGLCYATPRRSILCIKIVLLEGKPDPLHPLRGLVASLSLLSVYEYAKMLGCSQIEVQQPDKGAEAWYVRLGFGHDAKGRLVLSVSDS